LVRAHDSLPHLNIGTTHSCQTVFSFKSRLTTCRLKIHLQDRSIVLY